MSRNIRAEDLTECVALFYEEALQGQSFYESHAKLAALVNCTSALTFTPCTFEGDHALFDSYKIPNESFWEYSEYYYKKDIWTPLAMSSNIQSGTVVVAERYLQEKTLLASEFYNDFLRRYEIGNVCCLILSNGTDSHLPRIHTSLYRPDYKKRFGKEEERTLDILSAKLRRAIELRNWFGSARRDSQLSMDVLETIPHGVIILDSRKSVVFVNGAARSYLEGGEWLRIKDGYVSIKDVKKNRTLQRLLDSTLNETAQDKPEPYDTLVVSHESLNDEFVLNIRQIPLRVAADIPPDDKYVGIFVKSLQDTLGRAVRFLRNNYGLTYAEARLLMNLSKGITLQEYACRKNVSMNTVRTQAKHILSKTNTSRQSELVSLVYKLSQ